MPAPFQLQLALDDTGGVQVSVLESAGGCPHGRTDLKLTPVARAAALRLLEKPDLQYGDFSREEQAGLTSLGLAAGGALVREDLRHRALGKKLYDILFPSSDDPNRDVEKALSTTRAKATADGSTIALQVRFPADAVALAELPWELIRDREDDQGRFLVADAELRLARYIAYGSPNAPLPVSDRLDILVVSPRPKGVPALPDDVESEAIANAFDDLAEAGKVRLAVLDRPSLEELTRTLARQQFDVIHFDGHGGMGWRCPYCDVAGKAIPGQDRAVCMNVSCPGRTATNPKPMVQAGVLAFEDDSGSHALQLVTAEQLVNAMKGSGVRLFVASACMSGKIGAENAAGATLFNSVGPALIAAGIPSVVANQFSIPVDTAACFVQDFYSSLARHESIAAAIGAARKVLATSQRWYIPALYLQNHDGEGMLFGGSRWAYLPTGGAELPPRPKNAAPYKNTSPYEIIDEPVFFGREAERKQLVQRLLDQHIVVLTGPADVGKTSLVSAGLVPELYRQGIPTFVLREYEDGDPVRGLRRLVGDTPGLEDALDTDTSLKGTLRSLRLAIWPGGRPDAGEQIAVVFDTFEHFLRRNDVGARRQFFGEVASLRESPDWTNAYFLFVVRDDSIGKFYAADLPQVNAVPFALGLLKAGDASEAITEPLIGTQPNRSYKPAFLDTLLTDLQAAQGGQGISPLALQIVCSTLYDAAAGLGPVGQIDERLYPQGGVDAILGEYVDRAVQSFAPEERKLVRELMRSLVSPSGQREIKTAEALADLTGASVADSQDLLDQLQAVGLLSVRVPGSGGVEYSLAYRFLAEQVSKWFDTEAAEDARARAALDRAWRDWQDWLATPRKATAEGASPGDARGPLLDASTLATLAARRKALDVSGPQACLLLRSAVASRADLKLWADDLAGNPKALVLLNELGVDASLASAPPSDAAPAVSAPAAGATASLALSPDALAAGQALGLESPGARTAAPLPGGLVGAAVGFEGSGALHSGAVRHTAALVIGALAEKWLTLEPILAIETALRAAQPLGKPWRTAQALAQMQVAGFQLPHLVLRGRWLINLWALGIRMWDGDVLGRSVFGGLGAMSGAALALMLVALLSDQQSAFYFARSFIVMPFALTAGFGAVAFAELFGIWPTVGRRRVVRSPRDAGVGGATGRAAAGRRPRFVPGAGHRIAGFTLGFVIGLAVLTVSGLTAIDTTGNAPPWLRYVLTYVLASAIWGAGIALGREAALAVTRPGAASLLLGGGLGGALACLLILVVRSLLPLRLFLNFNMPLIGTLDLTMINWIEAPALGFGLGGGLAAGWELGAQLWRRLRLPDEYSEV